MAEMVNATCGHARCSRERIMCDLCRGEYNILSRFLCDHVMSGDDLQVWKEIVTEILPDGSQSVIFKNAGKDTLAGLQMLRQKSNFYDIILKVQNGEIRAHRNVLSLNSAYFHNMLVDTFKETHCKEISMESVNKKAAEVLVDFMYTGTFTVTEETAKELVIVADQWQMTNAKNECCEYIALHMLSISNCLELLNFAECYNCKQLEVKCKELLQHRFPLVIKTDQWNFISVQQLSHILSFDDLTLGHQGEDVVLEAVMRWVEYESESRSTALKRLLPLVHLSHTSKTCRARWLDNNPLVVADPGLQKVIEECMSASKQPRSVQTTLFVIGGFLHSHTGFFSPRLKGVERFNPAAGQWTAAAEFPMLSSATVALNLHGHLLCSALEPIKVGRAIQATETGIFEYDFISNEWRDAKRLFSIEVLHALDDCQETNGAITVCQKTNTIYTVATSQICMLPVLLINGEVQCSQVRLLPRPHEFMAQGHCKHSAVVLDGKLYVLGGDGKMGGMDPVASNLVIMFDSEQNKWIRKASMLQPRIKMGIAELNGYIYVSGGFNVHRLKTVERYDPVGDTWTEVQCMKNFRSHHQLIAVNNKLWAIGGKSILVSGQSTRNVVNTVEVYDPVTNMWTEGPPMKSSRCSFAGVAI